MVTVGFYCLGLDIACHTKLKWNPAFPDKVINLPVPVCMDPMSNSFCIKVPNCSDDISWDSCFTCMNCPVEAIVLGQLKCFFVQLRWKVVLVSRQVNGHNTPAQKLPSQLYRLNALFWRMMSH